MKLAEMRAELQDYQPILPPANLTGGAVIDAEVCAKSACRACGHVGMEYHPYSHTTGEVSSWTGRVIYAYRAFVVCPACGEAEEF